VTGAEKAQHPAVSLPVRSPRNHWRYPPSLAVAILTPAKKSPYGERFGGSRVESMLFFYRSWLVSWDRPFDQPIPLPSGSPARTFRDAANYIRKLPKSEYDKPEWRLAVQMLIDAAEDRGPMLFARMGILRATERHSKSGFGLSGRAPPSQRRKLKRIR
jgi:hypothetical protein